MGSFQPEFRRTGDLVFKGGSHALDSSQNFFRDAMSLSFISYNKSARERRQRLKSWCKALYLPILQ